MKKLAICLVLLGLCSLTFAGCKDKASKPIKPAGTATTPAADEPAADKPADAAAPTDSAAPVEPAK